MSDPDGAPEEPGKVGYRNPPRHTRFQPGQSGNPRGRPRGTPNLANEIARIMAMPVTVTVKGRRRTVRSLSAFALRLREQALGGDLKAMAMLFAHFQAHSSQDNEAAGLSVLLAEDAAILRDAGLIASEGASPGDSTEDRDGDA